MALILSLETASTFCSAALHEDGRLFDERRSDLPQSASSRLAVLIKDLWSGNKVSPDDLAAVAISSGPGSYTGLRIGVSTAKGLCFGLDIPLLAVNTLELMAFQVMKDRQDQSLLCPMLDARRMEVYCLLANSRLEILEPTDARIIDEQSFSQWLAEYNIVFFGDGAGKCRSVLKHDHATFLEGVVPLASGLGELAFRRFEKKEFEDASAFEPHYLKEFMIKKLKTT